MTVALDLGCSEFRSLRREGSRLIARRMPAVYTMLADTPAHRRALEQAQVAFARSEGSFVIIGEHALDVAQLFSRPLIPVFSQGQLPQEDPVGRQVCAWLVDQLLPASRGEICWMATPSSCAGDGPPLDRTSRFLTQLVSLCGYRPQFMHPGSALALAELEADEYTGASLCFGSESIALALTQSSQPILECRYSRGAREVLDAFAHEHQKFLWDSNGNQYVDYPALHQWLRQSDLSFHAPAGSDQRWLANAVQELLLAMWSSLKRKMQQCRHVALSQELPLVVSGGMLRIPGCLELVRESLQLSRTKLRISDIRAAAFDPYAITRGLLIQAELHATQPAQAAA